MDLTFKTQGTNTYLVYTISDGETVDTMSLGMLTNNKIPGLATTVFAQMDATKYIKYNVTAKVSVRKFFSGAVNKKRLLGVFKGIVNGLLSAEDYMIDESTILLDLDYIFADVTSCETVLICLPINGEEHPHNLGKFFKDIMFSTQFDQTENCDHVAKIINYLNSAPTFSLENFKNLLFEIDRIPSTQSVPVNPDSKQRQQSVIRKNDPPERSAAPEKQNADIPSGIPIHEGKQLVVPPEVIDRQSSTKGNDLAQTGSETSSESQAASGAEKKISLLDLLMHYSKEKAALYKAQKAKEKTKKASLTSNASSTSISTNFAVPNFQGVSIPERADSSSQTAAPESFRQTLQEKNSTSASRQREQVSVSQSPEIPGRTKTASQGKSANFGDTTVLSGGNAGETTVLDGAKAGSARTATPILVRRKNNEKIPVNKPVFRIGKEKSYADYFVSDNTAVSRSHADIIYRDGKFFIMDTNSTNHTYVNGAMIQSNTETPLNSGDTVRLANEEFEFKIV